MYTMIMIINNNIAYVLCNNEESIRLINAKMSRMSHNV